jgi:hypothetical protein
MATLGFAEANSKAMRLISDARTPLMASAFFGV